MMSAQHIQQVFDDLGLSTEEEREQFRTKKGRSLELKTPFHDCQSGRYKVAVKVVDIFGNDIMKIVEVTV